MLAITTFFALCAGFFVVNGDSDCEICNTKFQAFKDAVDAQNLGDGVELAPEESEKLEENDEACICGGSVEITGEKCDAQKVKVVDELTKVYEEFSSIASASSFFFSFASEGGDGEGAITNKTAKCKSVVSFTSIVLPDSNTEPEQTAEEK